MSLNSPYMVEVRPPQTMQQPPQNQQDKQDKLGLIAGIVGVIVILYVVARHFSIGVFESKSQDRIAVYRLQSGQVRVVKLVPNSYKVLSGSKASSRVYDQDWMLDLRDSNANEYWDYGVDGSYTLTSVDSLGNESPVLSYSRVSGLPDKHPADWPL